MAYIPVQFVVSGFGMALNLVESEVTLFRMQNDDQDCRKDDRMPNATKLASLET